MTTANPTILEKEPALAITGTVGLVTTALDAIYQAQQGQISWYVAAPLLISVALGVLVRFGVISPATHARIVQEERDAAAAAIPLVQHGSPILNVDPDLVASLTEALHIVATQQPPAPSAPPPAPVGAAAGDPPQELPTTPWRPPPAT